MIPAAKNSSTIWKYTLHVTDTQVINVPQGCEPLSVQYQEGVLCIWVLVPDVTVAFYQQEIHIYGTGNQMPNYSDGDLYIGTVQMPELPLVWHVFWVV